MYAKNGNLKDAQRVFEKMVTHDIITWNVMIGTLAEQGLGHKAFALFFKMNQEGFIPNASAEALGWVEETHKHALKTGLGSNVQVVKALFHMYAKIGRIEEAQKLFDKMVDHNVTTWNVMIGLLAKQGHGHESLFLLHQMQERGIVPTTTTFVNILNLCARVQCVEWMQEIHRHALEVGFELDIHVGNSLIHIYTKSGSIEDAQRVFDKMVERDVITWNMMMSRFA
jgi:pentatricopeptide repeat protein